MQMLSDCAASRNSLSSGKCEGTGGCSGCGKSGREVAPPSAPLGGSRQAGWNSAGGEEALRSRLHPPGAPRNCRCRGQGDPSDHRRISQMPSVREGRVPRRDRSPASAAPRDSWVGLQGPGLSEASEMWEQGWLQSQGAFA